MPSMKRPAMKRLAVVGGGPKGLAALVELDRALAGKASAPKIAVDIYEDSQPGSGTVWATATPMELIMNVPARIVDMSSPSFPQSYVRWALDHPNKLAREVYPPRAIMGQYLRDAFAAVAASPRFHVKHIRARVTAVEDAAATSTAWRVVASRDAQQEPQQFESSYDAVLLATGHHRPLPVSWYTDLQGSLSHNQGTSKHSQDTPNHVTIRGAALTAIDAVVCLTQGRGGTYAPHASRPGQLEYLPSGREPDTITLVSRTGLPLSPKPAALPAPLRQVIADATAPLVGLAHLSRTAPSAEWWDGLLAAGGQVADFLGLSTTPHSLRQVLFTPDRLRPNESAPQRMEQHLGMNRGDTAPDERWIWGRLWHSGYPNIIESLNRTPRDPEQWARFRTVAANAERWAYWPSAEREGCAGRRADRRKSTAQPCGTQ
jgi:hypothetical protein